MRKAWDSRNEAEWYIVGRIHFFRALFHYLDGDDPAEELRGLKRLLKRADAIREWRIEPVIDHLSERERLSPAVVRFFHAVIAALGDIKKVGALDDFPEWRNLELQPPDA